MERKIKGRYRRGEDAGYTACTLLRHPVNTDCKKVYLTKSSSWHSHSIFYDRGQIIVRNLPKDSTVLVDLNNGAAAGRFPVGNGVVYFMNSVTGTDSRRWHLNYWHWALGLKVPGSAETDTPGAPAITLAEAAKYDTVELRNGDTITGHITNEKFSIKTSYAVLTFEREKISRIRIEGSGANLDTVTLQIGDKMSGVLEDQKVNIKLVSGAETVLERDKIRAIRMRKKQTE